MGAVFAVRLALDSPTLGVALFYVIPTLLAALWWGPVGGGLAGLGATGLYALGGLIHPQPYLLGATLVRAALFCSLGLIFGFLIRRQLRLRAEVDEKDRELAELRALREALVPSEPPARANLALASCYVPAVEGVGGDFYIVTEGPNESTVVVVGDVIGKGLEAARRASFVRTALSTFAPFTDEPVRLLELANSSLIERAGTSEMLVTATCVTFRPERGEIAWASAGHPPPVLLDDGSELDGIRAGLPLGIAVDLGATRASRRFEPGRGLLLFTDGLAEARRPASQGIAESRTREQFGPRRVSEVLVSHRDEDPGSVVRALRAAVEEFAGGPLDDDLCLVAMRAVA
jgi:serine phosphatase RsbU (regulator of sigma subunit)